MSGIIIGTTSQKDGFPYTAKIAIGSGHYDYLRDVSGVSELRVNPDVDYHPLNSDVRTNSVHLEFVETFASLSAEANKVNVSGFNATITNIDGAVVTSQDFNFPVSKLVYMSDKPLIFDGVFGENSGLSLDGGLAAGTFMLIAHKGIGNGATMYWTSTDIDTMLGLLCGPTLKTC